jgi:phage terminase large subunit
VEEAQTISKESLEVLTPTVRNPGSRIIYTYNRFLEDDPVHIRLVIEGRNISSCTMLQELGFNFWGASKMTSPHNKTNNFK